MKKIQFKTLKTISKVLDVKDASEFFTDILSEINKHVEVTYHKQNYVFINLDDELNILKMHTKLFSKNDIKLNTCTCISDFASILLKIHQNIIDFQTKELIQTSAQP